jgi:hypothetical protein
MRKQIFPISFEVIQKHKYLYFFLSDIFMGVVTWLIKRLLFMPEPLTTMSSFLELFMLLWFFYPASFYIYESVKKKYEKRLCLNNEQTKDLKK